MRKFFCEFYLHSIRNHLGELAAVQRLYETKAPFNGKGQVMTRGKVLGAACGAAAALAVTLAGPIAEAASERPLFIALGNATRAPIGWIEFCSEYAPECETRAIEARDVVLSAKA